MVWTGRYPSTSRYLRYLSRVLRPAEGGRRCPERYLPRYLQILYTPPGRECNWSDFENSSSNLELGLASWLSHLLQNSSGQLCLHGCKSLGRPQLALTNRMDLLTYISLPILHKLARGSIRGSRCIFSTYRRAMIRIVSAQPVARATGANTAKPPGCQSGCHELDVSVTNYMSSHRMVFVGIDHYLYRL